jgi:hypothetical protein
MGHLGQDRETHGQRQNTIAQHEDLLHLDAKLDAAQHGFAKRRPAKSAADILVRPNLTI